MNLLYLVGLDPRTSLGHAAQRFRHIADAWAEAGHQVDIVFPAPAPSQEDKGKIRYFGLLQTRTLTERIVRAGQSFHFKQYGRRLGAELRKHSGLRSSYDALFAEELKMAEGLRHARRRWTSPTVLILHNFESDLDRQLGGDDAHLERAEKSALAEFDHVLAFTDVDAKKIELRFGIRLRFTRPGIAILKTATGPRDALGFIGALDYHPNVDALEWFLGDIRPRIDHRVPVIIAGRAPSARLIERCMRAGVEMIASPPDMAPIWARLRVSIVPLRIGSGARGKILESLAMGVAVVSTTLGAEGLGLTPDHHLAIADDADGLARAITRAMGDAELCRRQISAFDEVEVRFSYRRIADELLALISA